MDLMGWRNVRDLELQADAKLATPLGVRLSYHFFQLHEATGRWSNAGGANVGAGWDLANTTNTLGHELDFIAQITPFAFGGKGLFDSPLMIQPGYGVFIPQGAGVTLGGADAQHFAYLWLISTFTAGK